MTEQFEKKIVANLQPRVILNKKKKIPGSLWQKVHFS